MSQYPLSRFPRLRRYGLSQDDLASLSAPEQADAILARVSEVGRNRYRVVSEHGLHQSTSGGAWRRHLASERPTVGDWVWLHRSGTNDLASIDRLALRRNLLQRRRAGGGSDLQNLCANVDTVAVATEDD